MSHKAVTSQKRYQEDEKSSLPVNKSGSMQRITLAAACFGFFMVTLDTTVVNVALPSIRQALGAQIAGLQWVVDGYTLVFASLLLLAGALSDRFGSKRIFLAGLALFTLTSALCGAAPTQSTLIAARALQGLGAALLVPASLTVITYAYPEGRARAGAIGIWAAVSAIGAAAGPVVGGLLVESTGWRTVFFINIPVGVIGALLTWRFVSEAATTSRRSPDVPGQLTSIIALSALTFALIEGGAAGWNAPSVIIALIVFMLATIAFLTVEQRSASPMLPLALFRSSTFSAATTIGLLLNFSFYGLLFVLSLFFQQVQGLSAWDTGLRLLPLTAINMVGTMLSGQLTGRIGPRPPITGGLALCAGGIFAFLAYSNSANYIPITLCFLAIGFGSSLVVPALTTALLDTVVREQSGIASGVLNASRQAGGVFGIAVLGSFLNKVSGQAVLNSIHIALIVAGAALILGCVIGLLYMSSQGKQ